MDTELYKIVYETSDDGDLYAISLVEDPANSYEFIAMSKNGAEEIKLKAQDIDKQILTGVVLVPNQTINRVFKNGTPYEMYFEEHTIEKLAQDFMKKGYQSNSTFDHQSVNLSGTTVVESWIINDPENDKAKSLGFKGLPKGTWMVSIKLEDEPWQEYIKTGKAKGFSIDSYLKLEKVKQPIKLNKMKRNFVKEIITLFSQEAIKLSTVEVEGQGVLTADAFEMDNIVYKEVDGEMVPFLDAEWTFEGKIFKTDNTGKIVSLETAEVTQEEVQLDVAEDVKEIVDEVIEEVAKETEEVDVDALKKLIEELKAQLEIVTKEKEAVLTENIELSKQPASTKLKSNERGSRLQETQMQAIARIASAGKINK